MMEVVIPSGPPNYYVAVNTSADPTTFVRLDVSKYSINSIPNWVEFDPDAGSLKNVEFSPSIDGAVNC